MGTDGTDSGNSATKGLPLAEAYRTLDDRRLDIDRRMTALPPDDPGRDELWLELQPVLTELRTVVSDIANAPARSLTDIKAKAAVLADLISHENKPGGGVVQQPEASALALSLAEDIARFSGG